MTPDQFRIRVQQCRPRCGVPTDAQLRALCDLLEEWGPEIMALAAGRSHEDADARYGEARYDEARFVEQD